MALTPGPRDALADGVVRVISWIGAAALAASGGAWIVAPDTPGLGLLSLAGLVGVGGRLAFDYDRVVAAWQAPATRPMLAATTGACVLAGLGLLIAVGSESAEVRWDATSHGAHGPSPAMEATIEDLETAGVDLGELRVTGWYLAHGDSIQDLHRGVFVRARRAFELAAPTLSITLRDPATDAAGADLDGVLRSGTVLVRYDGREERLINPDEATLLGEIRRVALNERLRAVFTVGGGEPEVGRGNGLTALARRLRAAGFDIESRAHLGRLDGVDVVAVIGREHPLSEADVRTLADWVTGGGGLLVAQEAHHDAGPLAAMLTDWGLTLGDPVLDPAASDPSRPVLFPKGPHPLGLALRAGVATRTVCSVDAASLPDATTFTVLANRDGAAGAAVTELHPGGDSGGRVMTICDSDWARDPLFETLGNAEFAAHAFRMLALRDPPPAKPQEPPKRLRRSGSDRSAELVAVLLLPGMALFIAGAVRARR
jgi:hypothetical protein